jgi:C4-dicarboxylate-specific signal transduction histidine kinase
MSELHLMLIDLLSASTSEQASSLALHTLAYLTQARYAAVLLWDAELQRHIIADSQPADSADWRRAALRAAECLPQQGCEGGEGSQLEALCCCPLVTDEGTIVGALVYTPPASDPAAAPDPAHMAAYMRAAARALWTVTRLERAEREHAQLNAERQRLEALLTAVDQQQRTIDRLLTLEREFSAALEARIEERTAALRQAQASALHSEKLAVIGTLAASLAHEINNPLQAIQSGLGLVIADMERGRTMHARADLLLIQSELERIESIFRQMLDFNHPISRMHAPIDLNALCTGAQVLVRRRLDEAHITLALDLTPDLPAPCGDSSQIKQVLLNLILNSAEAVPDQGGAIHISTYRERDEVCLAVRDNGSGIHPDHQAHLFEPFFTTRARGLGLGLAICKQIIDGHNGHITVVSAPQNGTIFTMRLPIERNCHDLSATPAGG